MCLNPSIFLSADICVPISESVLSPHLSALDEPNKLSTKDHNWRKSGKAHAKHSLKGKIGSLMLCLKHVRWKRCHLWHLVTVVVAFSAAALAQSGLGGLIFLLFTVYMSYRVHGRRQSTNYVDNYPSAHMSLSVSPKHSMGSLEETTMPLLFLHLHKAIQTLSLTAHIV